MRAASFRVIVGNRHRLTHSHYLQLRLREVENLEQCIARQMQPGAESAMLSW
jgi:hypothetical protein